MGYRAPLLIDNLNECSGRILLCPLHFLIQGYKFPHALRSGAQSLNTCTLLGEVYLYYSATLTG
jgi:hypothetical protein